MSFINLPWRDRPLLGNRDFAIAVAGRALSVLGDQVALVTLTLRLQETHARPYLVALLLAAGLVPFVLLTRLAGRVADTVDSRRVLVTASLAQAFCCVPLIFARQPAELIVLVALIGAGAAFGQPTWQALVPRILGEQHLAAAISAQQTCSSLALVIGPALGGTLAGVFGTRVPIAVDAASFAVLAIAAMAVRTRRAGGRARAQEPAAKRERGGWAVLRSDSIIAPLVAGLVAFVLLVQMVSVVLVFLVRGTLHASPAWYGGVEAAWMVGVIAGAAVCARIRADGFRAQVALLGLGLIAAAITGYGFAPDVLAVTLLAVLGGLGNGLMNSCVSTLVVTRTDHQLRGRVSAALNGAVNGASVVSFAVGGGLAAWLAPRDICLIAGALGLTAATIAAARVTAATRRPAVGGPMIAEDFGPSRS
ncbi:MAG TPA: MFS transporter [Streptosporangiaceae bacterium]|jgi:MFS family permease